MFSKLSSLLSLLVWVGLLWLGACANPIPPTGGPIDEAPPKVVNEKSTPNFQTNFRPKRIELTFDEWIKVESAFTEIIASPPLEFDITLRGRTVQLEIDEDAVLRDSATYVINFGQAIKDLTESNSADNLRFVFSTGPTIDSLEVTGQLVDAYTGEPVEDMLFMLYENTADTVVRTEKPFYFARSDESGRFRVSNVRAGSFKAFALEDLDRNYLFNQPTERIGFPDSLVVARKDTSRSLTIKVFSPEQPLRVATVDTSKYGRAVIGFNRDPYDVSLDLSGSQREAYQETDQDSLRLFYDPVAGQSYRVELTSDTLLSDTIFIKPARALLNQDSLELETPSRKSIIAQNPSQPLKLLFTHPIDQVDTGLVRLLRDTLKESVPYTISVDTSRQRQVVLRQAWRANLRYQLLMLPGAVQDWYGRSNMDSIVIDLVVDQSKNYGNYLFRFVQADSSQQYVVRLLNKQDRLVTEYQLSDASSYERAQNSIKPGDYRVEIITDWNRNGRWDPGSYEEQIQPEPVQIRTLENLRANWDVEVEVDLSSAGDG